jgi:hypothetical protein
MRILGLDMPKKSINALFARWDTDDDGFLGARFPMPCSPAR